MSFSGMDVEEAESLAGALDIQAKGIAAVLSVVDQAVSALAEVWHGDDLAMFHASWHTTGRSRVQQASEEMSQWVTELRAQVAQQRAASGVGGEPGSAPGSFFASRQMASSLSAAVLGGFAATKVVTSWVGLVADAAETTKEAWKIEKLPGGGFLSPVLKGVGLGFSLGDLGKAFQRGDLSGVVKSGVDAGTVVLTAPLSLLWTGLSAEVGFFLPLDSEDADGLYTYMQKDRGMTPDQISKRWSGVSGFLNYGNDNVARHAPWLVKGADKLMEKPGEWLYDMETTL